MTDRTIQFLTEDDFNYITKNEKLPFLMFFTASFDENGKNMLSSFRELDKKQHSVLKIYGCDIDELPLCAANCYIFKIPCMILYKDGKEYARFAGYKELFEIEEWLRKNEVI